MFVFQLLGHNVDLTASNCEGNKPLKKESGLNRWTWVKITISDMNILLITLNML